MAGIRITLGDRTVRLSPSMQRGLLVVADFNTVASRSNVTDRRTGHVYWQAVDQLRDAGLITTPNHSESCLELTRDGYDAVVEVRKVLV